MAKLPRVSSEDVIWALAQTGFTIRRKRGKGSHALALRHEPEKVAITIPRRKEMPKGTLRAILRQADISVERFNELLRD